MKILIGWKTTLETIVYLVDTNVISEARKKSMANKGVLAFFNRVIEDETQIFLSVVTVGELRRGAELVRYRGDVTQAKKLEAWIDALLNEYRDFILDINQDVAQLWGRLRAPHPENALDKQIAAAALIYGLTVVTRNHKDFIKTGVPMLNPFTS